MLLLSLFDVTASKFDASAAVCNAIFYSFSVRYKKIVARCIIFENRFILPFLFSNLINIFKKLIYILNDRVYDAMKIMSNRMQVVTSTSCETYLPYMR